MSRKIPIGLVGVANHGATILHAILESGNLELVACYDKDLPASRRVHEQTGCRVAESYEQLAADPAIQAVALVTPNHLHADQFTKAMSAGKHVFVEKPISTTVREAQDMIALAEHSGRVLMVGHNTRRRRVFRRAKELLRENAIGKVVGIEGNLSRPVGLQPGLPPWKADPATCPLLPMTQLGIHFVDTVAFLLSPVKSVACVAANMAMPGNVPDSTAAILQLESGVPFALCSSYVSPETYVVRIFGTNGAMKCHATRLRMEVMEPAKVVEEDFSQEGAESYILQMREFGDCIADNRQPETGGREGLHALAVIEAMALSAARGTTVQMHQLI